MLKSLEGKNRKNNAFKRRGLWPQHLRESCSEQAGFQAWLKAATVFVGCTGEQLTRRVLLYLVLTWPERARQRQTTTPGPVTALQENSKNLSFDSQEGCWFTDWSSLWSTDDRSTFYIFTLQFWPECVCAEALRDLQDVTVQSRMSKSAHSQIHIII